VFGALRRDGWIPQTFLATPQKLETIVWYIRKDLQYYGLTPPNICFQSRPAKLISVKQLSVEMFGRKYAMFLFTTV
jgi:hypothetical protein